jgi:uncharacterized protein YlxW (UPF0749 family)
MKISLPMGKDESGTRIHFPVGKPEPWVVPLTVVSLVLGVLIAVLYLSSVSAQGEGEAGMRPEEVIRHLRRQSDDQEETIKKLNARITELMDNQQGGFQKELGELRIRAGVTPVQGPGIVITIDDKDQSSKNPGDVNPNALITHDVDLLMLLNELRVAGAEALGLNDQRVVNTTAVRCVGPALYVNNTPISAPFVVKAIGNVDTLYGAANLPYGVIDQLKPLGIHVDIEKRASIQLPSITVKTPLSAAQALKEMPKKEE